MTGLGTLRLSLRVPVPKNLGEMMPGTILITVFRTYNPIIRVLAPCNYSQRVEVWAPNMGP